MADERSENLKDQGKRPKVKAKAADVLPMKKAKALAHYFLGKDRPRYAAMVALGAGLGLRISDALAVTWRDVLDDRGTVKKAITVREQKTGNVRTAYILPWAKEVLEKVAKEKDGSLDLDEPIVGKMSKQRAWQVLKAAAEDLGFPEHISTHSLRKAWCDFLYEQTRDPVLCARLTGHKNPAHLLRYIRRVPEAEMEVWRRIAAAEI